MGGCLGEDVVMYDASIQQKIINNKYFHLYPLSSLSFLLYFLNFKNSLHLLNFEFNLILPIL